MSVQINGITATPIVRIGVFHCCTAVRSVIVSVVSREILPTVHVIIGTQAFIAFGNACSAVPRGVIGKSNAVFMFLTLCGAISDAELVFHGNISTDAVADALRVIPIEAFVIELVPIRVMTRGQGARTVLVSSRSLQPTVSVWMPTDSNTPFVLVTHRLTLFEVRSARIFEITAHAVSWFRRVIVRVRLRVRFRFHLDDSKNYGDSEKKKNE